MACGCRGRRTATPTRYTLTLTGGNTFSDGKTQRTFTTKAEAETWRTQLGGGVIQPVNG